MEKGSKMKRVVDTSFWDDDKVVDMFSPEDKYFFLYLMTNPHTTQLGIYRVNKKVMAFELGYDPLVVDTLLDRFENTYGIIIRSKESGEITILNYLRHSIVKGGEPIEKQLKREIGKVADKTLLEKLYNHLSKYDNLNSSVKKILQYLIDIYINANANANAWTGECTQDVHSHVQGSVHKRKKRKNDPRLTEIIEHNYEEYDK